jgi:hypothetical protein
MGPQNCWEFWDCPKEIKDPCPAYINDFGKKCFFIADDYCLSVKKEFKDCYECPWFKNIFSTGSYI